MSRSRLLWFSFGFATTYAVFSSCVLNDLSIERHALNTRIDNHFRALEARLSNIETSLQNHPSLPSPDQVEG